MRIQARNLRLRHPEFMDSVIPVLSKVTAGEAVGRNFKFISYEQILLESTMYPKPVI